MSKIAITITLYAIGSVCILLGMLSRLGRVNVDDRTFLMIGIGACIAAFAFMIQTLAKRKKTGNQPS